MVGTKKFEELSKKQRRREMILVALRTLLWATVLVVVYYLAPLDRPLKDGLVVLIGGLLVIAAVLYFQIRGILSSDYPRLRAFSALGIGVPLLLVVFAAVYFLVEFDQSGSFTQHLDKTGAMYFTITVFATVGFGDIAAVSGLARVLVSIQMIFDLFVIGIVAKVIFGAVQVGLQRKSGESSVSEAQLGLQPGDIIEPPSPN